MPASFVTVVRSIPHSPSVSSAQPEVRKIDISMRDDSGASTGRPVIENGDRDKWLKSQTVSQFPVLIFDS